MSCPIRIYTVGHCFFLLFYTKTTICISGYVQIQGWMSPLWKLGDERVNNLIVHMGECCFFHSTHKICYGTKITKTYHSIITSFFLPAAVFSIFSLFFFRFHFQGLKILPMADNLDFLSTGGVAVTEPLFPIELDFKLPFFFLSVKQNKKTMNSAFC